MDLSQYSDDELARIAGAAAPMSNDEKVRYLYDSDEPESDLGGYSDEELMRIVGDQHNEAQVGRPQAGIKSKPKNLDLTTVKDVGKSLALRGVPEGLAAATPLGFGLNIVRGVSDLTRYGAGKAYKAFTGEELPQYTKNPIPTSSDVINRLSKDITDSELYEPKTRAGRFANAVGQFASGGVASGVPLRATIPAAVVSEGAGQMAEGTDWEIPARLAGAMATPTLISAGQRAVKSSPTLSRFVSEESSAPAKIAPQATSEDIRQLASQAYQTAGQQGGILTPQFTNKFIAESGKSAPQTQAGKLLAGDSDVAKIVDRIKGLKDRPLNLDEAQEIDEFLGDAIDGFTEMGRVTKQGKKLLDIQTSFRRMIDDAQPGDLQGGAQGFQSLKDARRLWAAAARMRDVERIITRAEQMDVPATGIRTGFRTLYNNPNRMRGFNKEEAALIKKAAETGKATDLLRTFGSRLIAIGGLMSGNPASAAAATAASTASRSAAGRLQLNRAQKIINKIAEDATVSKVPPPAAPAIQWRPGLPLSILLNQTAAARP